MAGLQKTRLNHVDCTVEVIAPASYPQPGNVDRFSDEWPRQQAVSVDAVIHTFAHETCQAADGISVRIRSRRIRQNL